MAGTNRPLMKYKHDYTTFTSRILSANWPCSWDFLGSSSARLSAEDIRSRLDDTVFTSNFRTQCELSLKRAPSHLKEMKIARVLNPPLNYWLCDLNLGRAKMYTFM